MGEDTEFTLELRRQPAPRQGEQRPQQQGGGDGYINSDLFHGTITEAAGSKGQVLLFILYSSVLFRFFYNKKILMCFLYNYINDFNNNNNNKEFEGERGPQNLDLGAIDTQVTGEALKSNVINTRGKRQGKTRVQRQEKSGWYYTSATQHKPSQLSEVRGKQKGKAFSRTFFYLKLLRPISFSPFGRPLPGSQVSRGFAEGKVVWSNISERWFCSVFPSARPRAGRHLTGGHAGTQVQSTTG